MPDKKPKFTTKDRTYMREDGIVAIRKVEYGKPQVTDSEWEKATAEFNATMERMWGPPDAKGKYHPERVSNHPDKQR